MHEMQEMWVQSLGQEDPLENEMATCSSILVWEIPWTDCVPVVTICRFRNQDRGHKESDTTEWLTSEH